MRINKRTARKTTNNSKRRYKFYTTKVNIHIIEEAIIVNINGVNSKYKSL